ncbi:hypothetical protein FSP39_022065 [Pinctada imbricata]|uniref:Glycine receptor subunit alpha-2 n=1 Tax=Pinctada imbricata TaxID=66713 RepID=A0AA89C4D7_PINIB|nr:hypothetical protein FSP39_022065 [Pinctada imbricata]
MTIQTDSMAQGPNKHIDGYVNGYKDRRQTKYSPFSVGCSELCYHTKRPTEIQRRQVVGALSSLKREEILNDLIRRHDSRIPPVFASGDPATIRAQLYILSVYAIDDYTMDFKMTFFLRLRWYDPRLTFPDGNVSRLELDTGTMSKIWVPDLYIVNEKKADVHDVTVPNKLMHIYPDGLVVYSMRVTGQFACDMNLLKYPFDSQKCDVRMESYGYSMETILFRWQDVAAMTSPKMKLPQFGLEGLTNYICDVQYAGVNFTCIGLSLQLGRRYGFHIIQIYVPSILIVLLSWVSFWLNIDAIPARISLGLLTILTMTTQSSGARASLPKVSYVKAIDVWMAMCLIFVFLALIEFAYVNVLARVEKRRKESLKDLPMMLKMSADDGPKEEKKPVLSAASREKARTVDRVSRILFPSVFLGFNIVYWTTYMIWEPKET